MKVRDIMEIVDPTLKVRVMNGFDDTVIAESEDCHVHRGDFGDVTLQKLSKACYDMEPFRMEVEDGVLTLTTYE